MSKGIRVRKKLYGRASNGSGGGGATPPAGADGAIQYNNGGSFGGFGVWDDSLLQLVLAGALMMDQYNPMQIRESAAQPYRQLQIVNWVGSTTAQTGNSDRNVFMSDTITDAIATILVFGQGIKSDGSMGISKLMLSAWRKDGVADPVQIGATTDLAAKEDSPNTPTITMGPGIDGTIRISYDSNNVGDNYTWNFWAVIAFTKV